MTICIHRITPAAAPATCGRFCKASWLVLGAEQAEGKDRERHQRHQRQRRDGAGRHQSDGCNGAGDHQQQTGHDDLA